MIQMYYELSIKLNELFAGYLIVQYLFPFSIFVYFLFKGTLKMLNRVVQLLNLPQQNKQITIEFRMRIISLSLFRARLVRIYSMESVDTAPGPRMVHFPKCLSIIFGL